MNISRIVAVFAVALLAAASVFANDRENYSVGTLQVESVITATDGSMTISNATIVSPTITSPTITAPSISGQAALANVVASGYITEAGRRVVTSSTTNDVMVQFGTGATNAQIVTFSPVFTGTPVVFVRPTTYSATNAANFGPSSVTPTNATINGLDDDMSWIAIGTK